jgi:hypothetical protein
MTDKRIHKPGPDEELIEPLTVRIKTARARITGFAVSTIYAMIARGDLEVVRKGGQTKSSFGPGRGAGATLINYKSLKRAVGIE